MIESVQVRQRGAYDFESHYDNLCAMQDSCPLPAVKAHLAQNVLDINGDRVRVTDWMPILNTLRINKSLEFIAIRSYYTPPSEDNEKKANIERRKMPSVRSKEITYRLCKALKECLMNTPTLSCIELQGLPLRERDLTTLMKGLVKNQTLNHLSLEYCRIGDTGLDIVCKGAKNSTSINSVNFTGCSLSGRGAESLAKVIKHQAMKRHNEAWRDSLRYRRPDLDRMPGIRRITINNNPMMGDQGASLLAEALKDDLWLKALDMQGTGVSTTGARALLDVLKYNTTIVVLDVRRNPLIDRDVVHNIMEQLMINCNGQDTEYKWIKADDPVESNKKALAKKRRTKTLNSSFGRKTTIRITAGAARRRTKSTGSVGVSRKVQPISSEEVKAGPGLPWRTAARANRYRGYPPEHIPGMARLFENSEASPPSSPDQSASVIITKDDSLAEDDTLQELERLKLDDSGLLTGINKMNNIKDLRVEIVQLKRRLQEERIARANAEDRVVKLTIENKRLREQMETVGYSKGGGILDDDSVLDTIEASFKQFHEFLDLLRDAGLGQLITMAGLDRQGSPFAQQGRSTFPQKMSQFKSSSSIPPRPVKPNMKSNGYFGDISSSNWVSASHSSKEEEKPVKFGKFFDQESPNKFSYFSARDPTMDSHLDDSHQNGGPSKKDDLYDRIVNETSGAFPHLTQNGNSENVLQMKSQMGAAEKSYQKPENAEKQDTNKAKKGLMEEDYSFEKSDIDQSESQSHSSKPIPQPRGRKSSAEEGGYDSKLQEQGKDTSNENIHLMSEKEIPEHKSKVSEVNYSMDSFEQSYLSERGEVIHLEGDFDMYDSSPSLPPQVIDSEENDF